MRTIILIAFFWWITGSPIKAQDTEPTKPNEENKSKYKKRVLETTEIDVLSSYYRQDGDNAAVSGGIGTENLDDATATIIVSIPLNDDDVLTIDAGVSAYTSASSSNVNPFDGGQQADPFVASSGESISDIWSSGTISYSHSSDDRNKIFGVNASLSAEYDYTSIGFGGNFTQLLNQKNTEFSIKASAFLDTWSLLYPSELRAMGLLGGGDDDEDERFNINRYQITGNANYTPRIVPLSSNKRNSYSLGLGFSQIINENLQGSLGLDLVYQTGQLSTPFQRVYFADVADSFIEKFHLADDIERLPSNRFKVALGGRLNYYINESISLRSFYRYYQDDWELSSHTASIEVPVKLLTGRLTLYPSYRYYQQSGFKYFAPYNQHQSTSEFYTSDFDLSDYHSHQLGFGLSYNNLYGTKKLWKLDGLNSDLITLGVKFKLW